MKDPNRLLDDPSLDPLEGDLLRLARSEGPSGESRRRILAGLGVATAVGAASHASASEPLANAAAPSATVGAASSSKLKWALGGAAVVGASIAAFLLLGNRTPQAPLPQNPPAVVVPAPTTPPAATADITAQPAADSAKVTKLEDLPTLTDSPAAADSTHVAAPSLADEVLAIKGAKSALAAGNAADALHQLDAYRTRFPRGRLMQEATVVRIEALLKSGNAASANAIADKFLAAHADSPYAARVHSLIGR